MANDQTPPPIQVHDTLARGVHPLALREEGKVSVYCCGPTTYDVAHVGHARAAVAFDLLVRVLRHRGLQVTYVRNVTDVDDKILNRAKESGEEPTALSARMAQLYDDDMAAIGCEKPTHEPRVSQTIPEIIDVIDRLVKNDAAYVVPGSEGSGGDVYFRVRAFPGYGKLSGRNVDEMRSGARIEVDERKEDPLDFALWKGCAPGEWGWDSPWGRGRPGWHIECSAMSAKFLGHGFDIHAGGMDLIFPHHENEIAQSEAAFPGQGDFARCWMHNGFVNIDKEKMSKSLGNFVTVRDVLQRNDPEALRLFLLVHHYRGPIGFDVDKLDDGRVVFPGIDEAERKIDYLYTTIARLDGMTVAIGPGDLPKAYADALSQVQAARHEALASLADDLGAANAVAALYRVAATLNEMLDLHVRKKADRPAIARVIGAAQHALREIADVLGILRTTPTRYQSRTRAQRLALLGVSEADVEAKVEDRVQARKAKDFARADAIRGELEGMGVELFDGPAGTTWKVKK
ncbi:MAG: cysteine--tRNA ligase [Deltaproteobacteria bacterium]|nr:cysteine--tRNA ligase [Deltaproteobacteria bacterium]